VIKELEEAGVKTTMKKGVSEDILKGKTFVVTGTLKNYTRQGAEELIRNKGGNTSSGVSKNTDFLIAGQDAGTKLKKAKNLSIKIISENEFKKMIGAR